LGFGLIEKCEYKMFNLLYNGKDVIFLSMAIWNADMEEKKGHKPKADSK